MSFPLLVTPSLPPPVFKMSGLTYKAELVRPDKMGDIFEPQPTASYTRSPVCVSS